MKEQLEADAYYLNS